MQLSVAGCRLSERESDAASSVPIEISLKCHIERSSGGGPEIKRSRNSMPWAAAEPE